MGVIYGTCEYLHKLCSFKGSRRDFLRGISGRVHISTRVKDSTHTHTDTHSHGVTVSDTPHTHPSLVFLDSLDIRALITIIFMGIASYRKMQTKLLYLTFNFSSPREIQDVCKAEEGSKMGYSKVYQL